MHAESSHKAHKANVSDLVRLDVLKEELDYCNALSGYMASASVVQSYLEKRVFQLEQQRKYVNKNQETSEK